jgi:CubicO group peptidase (beta-lactamase class C family)
MANATRFAANVLPMIREVQAADPEPRDVVLRTTVPTISNDVDFFPGIKLKWDVGHLITTPPVPEGCSASSLTWAGIYNTYLWIDPKKRIAAVFMTRCCRSPASACCASTGSSSVASTRRPRCRPHKPVFLREQVSLLPLSPTGIAFLKKSAKFRSRFSRS